MKLQKGKFLINNIGELDSIPNNMDCIRDIIDLEYMRQFEYGGNSISFSRMFIEYYKEDYCFYPTQIFTKEGKQMYIYANANILSDKLKENSNFIFSLASSIIERSLSLWEYVNKKSEECIYDFWWDIESNYLILFGEDKKEMFDLFINECYKRDVDKKLILTVGYKI